MAVRSPLVADRLTNLIVQAVWYDVYKNHPVPSATSQFVIEGGNPTLVPGGLKMPVSTTGPSVRCVL